MSLVKVRAATWHSILLVVILQKSKESETFRSGPAIRQEWLTAIDGYY
ncbi:MAG: hypothetical protein NTU47_16265 [Ignavibacteriales bacterium]|nr:hypothetical protein [Ignavibacteriales bacterium]